MEKIRIGEQYAYLEPYIHQYQYQNKLPTIVLCPGGSYLYTSRREAAPVAYQFLAKGYNVFVLHYSTMSAKRMEEEGLDFESAKDHVVDYVLENQSQPAAFPQPLLELALTMKFLHENHEQYHIDTDHIITMGFSAGANLVSLLGSHWHRAWLQEAVACRAELLKPYAQVVSYGYMDNMSFYEDNLDSDVLEVLGLTSLGTKTPDENLLKMSSPTQLVSEKTPASFIWHTRNDKLIPVQQAIDYASALNQHHVPFELHIYDQGDHGYASASKTSQMDDAHIRTWIDLADGFIQKRMELRKE